MKKKYLNDIILVCGVITSVCGVVSSVLQFLMVMANKVTLSSKAIISDPGMKTTGVNLQFLVYVPVAMLALGIILIVIAIRFREGEIK
jgi:hypothetical protein